MTVSAGWLKARRRLIGIVFLATFALLIWLSLAIYNKQFTPVSMVTLYTASAGNEMNIGAQVMVRGVQVGEVRQITANGHGARLELAIDPGMVHLLPANVTAQMLPTTLFGARYVDLMLPARPATARLVSGSVISQDRSADAIEIEQVLNNLLPLLTAVQPQQLSLTLTAIAQGAEGPGHQARPDAGPAQLLPARAAPAPARAGPGHRRAGPGDQDLHPGHPGHPAGADRLLGGQQDGLPAAGQPGRAVLDGHHGVP